MPSITCLNSFDGIAGEWNRLLPYCATHTLFMTVQWQQVWWRELGNGAPLWLLQLTGDDGVQGIAPLTVSEGIVTLVGSHDVSDYNDFLVRGGVEVPFYEAFLDYLAQKEWSALKLFSLLQDSPTLVHLPKMAQARGYSVEIRQDDVSPGVCLPDSWDQYLAGLSRKNRHELRRKLRRLNSTDQVRWYALTKVNEIEEEIDNFLALMRLSKQEKHHFLTPERDCFFHSIATETSSMGVARLFFMEINGQKVASALCFDYGSSRLLYNSGYNPDYGYYSVGLLLKALTIRSAIEEGKEYFDFLRGDESYKYDLGGRNRLLYTMMVTRR